MPQQQVEAQEVKTALFDENGQTVEETEQTPEPLEQETEQAVEEQQVPQPEKYRIGDKSFATQEEALAYAQSQVSALETEQQLADAYRQGIRDAALQGQPVTQPVTPQPQAPEFDPSELYTNPEEFLAKFATKIKTDAQLEVERKLQIKEQSDAIWNEFTKRHPMLADFRNEVENYTGDNAEIIKGITATKGRTAAYDYIATKIKARFEAYANAVKPKRELPNTTMATSPTSKGTNVTPKEPIKKALSFAEQVRSIRKRK